MFAVPGWSVSAADLKTQTEIPTTQSASTSANEKSKSQTKKRKRGQNKNVDKVTESNVDEMFKRHIQGDEIPRTNGGSVTEALKGSKKKHKRKNRGLAMNSKEEANGGIEEKPNKKQKKAHDGQPTKEEDKTEEPADAIPPPPPPPAAKLTPLQQKMRDKLVSARFRYLNETLYTSPSTKALEMFSNNPEFFAEYHAGFSKQVKESWPSNPVDGYIQTIRSRAKIPVSSQKGQKGSSQRAALPRRPNGFCTIADLGCGDAQLARALTPSADKLKLKFLNYDLHSPDPLITKADISNLPLPDGSVDVAIFCLSLMGTNWISFIEEAWRVLRSDGKGECWVSEVKSRFGKVHRKKGAQKPELSNRAKKKLMKKKKGKADDSDAENDSGNEEIYAEDVQANSDGQDETDISAFVDVMSARGFRLKPDSVDKSNKMFVRMEFVKVTGAPTRGKYAGVTPGKPGAVQSKTRFIEDGEELTPEEEAKVLKPCVYKTR
ncbi:hypothetical protein VTN49DRAFT_4125 [Thermomyces lanuginosus]|uniref:uncharacterized protein n=1 Tax=Thermomyces lanuginosus TaxID=5541 RepID=UPI003743D7B5